MVRSITARPPLARGLAAVLIAAAGPATAEGQDAPALYQTYCAACHGLNREGGARGTALSPDAYRHGGGPDDLIRSIAQGIEAGGMPGFRNALNDDEITALAAFLATSAAAGAIDAAPAAAPEIVESLDYVIRAEVFAEGLETPWALAFIDADTALITERPGRLRLVRGGVLDERPIAGTPEVLNSAHEWNQGGLLDVAVDPDHGENGWVYLAYSHARANPSDAGAPVSMTRVVRGRIRDHAWTDQETVFEAGPAAYDEPVWHYGGRLAFDTEGRVFLSVGDRGAQDHAQALERPSGKIHRVTADGAIPPDNPFRDRPGAIVSIYSYGNRNPQGLAFDAGTGALWQTEHGPRGGDELNIITAGANYGWPAVSYGINYDGTVLTERTRAEGVRQPAFFWRPSIGVSGIAVYEGAAFPLWRGKLLVTGLSTRDLRVLTRDGDRILHEEIVFTTPGRPYEPVVGPDGAVYLVTDDPGQVLRLTPHEERRT